MAKDTMLFLMMAIAIVCVFLLIRREWLSRREGFPKDPKIDQVYVDTESMTRWRYSRNGWVSEPFPGRRYPRSGYQPVSPPMTEGQTLKPPPQE